MAWRTALPAADAGVRVARATAYLFKIPEGGAKGVDPGFQRQMQELEAALKEATGGSDELISLLERGILAGIITNEQAKSLKDMMNREN